MGSDLELAARADERPDGVPVATAVHLQAANEVLVLLVRPYARVELGPSTAVLESCTLSCVHTEWQKKRWSADKMTLLAHQETQERVEGDLRTVDKCLTRWVCQTPLNYKSTTIAEFFHGSCDKYNGV